MYTVALAALVATGFSFDDPVTSRPRTTYVQVEPNPSKMFAAGDPMVLFMNRDGGSFTCDNDDAAANKSSIACGSDTGVANVGAFSGTDAQWQTVFTCIQDLYSPFNMTVTDVKPDPSTQYIEAVIGGSPDQAGQPGGVAGVAPFTCGVIPGAVVYDFADVWGNDLQSICETAGQEVAHAFGLDHEYLCEDPMTYLIDCGPKTFQDQWVPCGEYEPRECACGDPTQNSVNAMYTLFGPADGTSWTPPVDTEPPTATITSPEDNAQFPGNTTITVTADVGDDTQLTLIALDWDFTGEQMFCPAVAGAGAYTCEQQGRQVTWTIDTGVGMRTFRLHVRDTAGNEVVTDDRHIWMSPDGNGPPDDHTPPVIALGSPLPHQVMPAATPFPVVVTIVDDTSVARAELNWQRHGEDNWLPCPYADDRGNTCKVDGSTYTWTVQGRRDGPRMFAIRAIDVLGNKTETDVMQFTITTGAAMPTGDDNDALDQAQPLSCGDSVEVDGNSADWFDIDAPKDTVVNVDLETTDGAAVSLLALDGNTLVSDGSTSAQLTAGDAADGHALHVGVVPAEVATTTSVVHVTCREPKKAAPTACSSTDVDGGVPFAGLATLVGGLALVTRRRRR